MFSRNNLALAALALALAGCGSNESAAVGNLEEEASEAANNMTQIASEIPNSEQANEVANEASDLINAQDALENSTKP